MVKFEGSLHSPLEFGHVLIVSGTSTASAEKFVLNLTNNNALDIPLHMNVIFGEKNQIIRNTKINGEFGAAENMGGMITKQMNPLRAGEICWNLNGELIG